MGCHKGPFITFIILFINDTIFSIEHSEILLLADDAKIFKAIYSPSDAVLLQNDLDSFKNCCVLNGMILNKIKCKSVTFSNKKESKLI